MRDLKCPKCDSRDFYVHETEVWKASIDEEDQTTINCWHKSSAIDYIECAKCQEDLTEMSTDTNINFNFQ